MAFLYEFNWLFHQTFSTELFNNGAYFTLLLAAILPGTFTMAIFYFFIKYPFCKTYHWLIAYVLGVIVTAVLTYNTLAKFLAVYIVAPGTYPDIEGFVFKFVLYNCLIAIIVTFIATLLFKRAPLPQRNIPWKK